MNKIFYVLITTALFFNSCKNGNDKNELVLNQTPKNIILLVGDGMGLAQVYAAMTVKKDKLNIEQAQIIGFSKTSSADNYVTDSAAGATAFACGEKTKNGYIGVDSLGHPLKSILEYAEDNGLATGLVATSSITHATPASFIGHQVSRKMYEQIAYDFLKTDIDVFIGGGKNDFAARTDSINLIDSLIARNYQISYDIDNAATIKNGKLACFTADVHNLTYAEGRGEMLVKGTQTAINLLRNNDKGFFLMVEGSMIDWGGHDNNINFVTSELIDFDNAVGAALEFAKRDGNTLVIITADHETGGLSLVGGNRTSGELEVKFSTDNHTGVMVPVYVFGPGAEKFAGIYENTAIFHKMYDLYGFQKN